jgi:hypothetical protein
MTNLEETLYDYEEIGSLFLSPVVALYIFYKSYI